MQYWRKLFLFFVYGIFLYFCEIENKVFMIETMFIYWVLKKKEREYQPPRFIQASYNIDVVLGDITYFLFFFFFTIRSSIFFLLKNRFLICFQNNYFFILALLCEVFLLGKLLFFLYIFLQIQIF